MPTLYSILFIKVDVAAFNPRRNFCGGEVSGVKDIAPQELDQVRARLLAILSTARFDPR
jgi:hypothetical protein